MAILILVFILLAIVVVFIFLFTGLFGAPYVPTDSEVLKMLDKVYKIRKGDLLIDLGAGDGKVLEEASKRGAKAIGVEINPILVFMMKMKFFRDKKVQIRCRNFFNYKFPKDTTVVYSFMLGLNMGRVYSKIEKEATRLKKPIYLISNAFDVSDKKPVKHVGYLYLYEIKPVLVKK